MIKYKKGFTLVELLVVISIVGILLSLSIFSLQGARESSRDAKRKSDLELIRSGLEMYKSDCNYYPTSSGLVLFSLPGTTSLYGFGSPATCATTNVYISSVPLDPVPTQNYSYSTTNAITYTLCAALEKAPSPAIDITGCGSCGVTCNYKVTNP